MEEFIVTKASRAINYIWAAVKIMIGISFSSYFFCVSGLYTFAVGLCKEVYLYGKNNAEDSIVKEKKYYLLMCGILTIASVLFIIYMTRFFFLSPQFNYGRLSMIIAIVAVVELIVALIGLKKSSRMNDLLKNGLKCVNLTSAFTALVLTQIAIFSFIQPGKDMSLYNAITGIISGCACLLVCGYMLIKSKARFNNQSLQTG